MTTNKSPGIGVKLAFVGLLLLAPLILTTGALIAEWRSDISVVIDERDGLIYVAQLRNLIDPLTAHRGTTTLALAKTPGAAARSLALETKVDQALTQLTGIDAVFGGKFHTASAVAEIDARWTALKRGWPSLSIDDDRSAHNALAAQILALNETVATAAKFAIDPRSESHYLLDAVGMRLLPIANLTGWMRSQLAAAAVNGILTGRDRDRLVSNYQQLQSSMDLVRVDIAKVNELHDSRFPALAALYDEYQRTAGDFRKLTEEILEGSSITVSPDTIMEVGGHDKEAVFALYDNAHSSARRELDDRLYAAYRYVVLTLAVILGLTLLAIVLAATIRGQLARQLKIARAAFVKMESGDFDSQLIAETRDEAGDVVAALARMQQSLKARIERDAVLAAVAEYTNTAVSTTDASGRILWLNAGFTRMTGLGAADVLGRLPEDLLERKAADPLAWAQVIAARSAGLAWRGEVRCLARDREYFALIESQPVSGADGSVSGYILIETDVTERRRAAEALREARDAAEAGNRAKSAFLANMSHEIRTPLNGVIGMTSLLLDGELDREQREFAEIARSSGETLLVLINDILDLSKIEAGHLEFEHLDFNLLTAVEACIDPVVLQAAKKDIEILVDIDPSLPRFVRGDPSRVRQIVLNLVSNAVKFTDRGEVRIAIRHIAASLGPKVLMEVRDNGIGMTESQLAGLFKPFTQADASTTRRFGGTGLGLSITKRLIDAMDGKIEVESRYGEGSVFRVEIPLECAAAPVDFLSPKDLAGRHVLVIEDHPVNQRILQTQLSSAGLRVSLAASVGEALKIWDNLFAAKDLPHLILLDHDLPDHDGLWLADRLRSATDVAMPPIILLTSLGGLVRAEALAKGCARVLTKPVKRDALLEALASALSRTGMAAPRAAPDGMAGGTLAGLRILVAEDNAVNQVLLVRLLEKLGAKVTLAGTGLRAIERLRDTPIDIILMDCQMPDLDGYEATQQIRAGTAGHAVQNLPIVALTAHALAGDRERCILAGMSDYLTKPVEPKALEAVILEYTARGRAMDAATPEPARSQTPQIRRRLLDQRS